MSLINSSIDSAQKSDFMNNNSDFLAFLNWFESKLSNYKNWVTCINEWIWEKNHEIITISSTIIDYIFNDLWIWKNNLFLVQDAFKNKIKSIFNYSVTDNIVERDWNIYLIKPSTEEKRYHWLSENQIAFILNNFFEFNNDKISFYNNLTSSINFKNFNSTQLKDFLAWGYKKELLILIKEKLVDYLKTEIDEKLIDWAIQNIYRKYFDYLNDQISLELKWLVKQNDIVLLSTLVWKQLLNFFSLESSDIDLILKNSSDTFWNIIFKKISDKNFTQKDVDTLIILFKNDFINVISNNISFTFESKFSMIIDKWLSDWMARTILKKWLINFSKLLLQELWKNNIASNKSIFLLLNYFNWWVLLEWFKKYQYPQIKLRDIKLNDYNILTLFNELKKIITKYNKLLDEHDRLKNRKDNIIKSNELIVTKINKFENDILEINKSINSLKNDLLDINKKISELEENKTQELENKKIPSLSIFNPVIRKLTNEINVLLDYKNSTNIEWKIFDLNKEINYIRNDINSYKYKLRWIETINKSINIVEKTINDYETILNRIYEDLSAWLLNIRKETK